MRRRRGFTLVEVLVALGLLVLIASLALPVALTRTDAARATTAQRILTLSPDAARGHARRLGGPVALVLLPDEDGRALRLAMVRRPDPESDAAADLAADPDDVSTWPTVDQTRTLPDGTRLWTGEPEALDDLEAQLGGDPLLEAALADAGQAEPMGSMDRPADPVVLAWFLSDGSALAGSATALRLPDGRVVRVRVESLEGRLVFTAAPELEEGGQDEPPADGRPPLEPDSQATPGGRGADPSRPLDARGFEPMEFEAPEFDRLEFEPLEFDRPQFARPEFDQLGFDSLGSDPLGFDPLGFDAMEFDPLGFDPLEFDPLEPGAPARPGRERRTQDEDPAERTNPEPPQPR